MDDDGQIHEQIRAVAAHDDDLRQCAEKDTDMVWVFNRGELACAWFETYLSFNGQLIVLSQLVPG